MKRQWRAIAALLIIACLAWPVAAFAQDGGAAPDVWSLVKGKALEQRQSLLEASHPDMKGWQTGAIVSRDPFAIVTEFAESGREVKAKVRIWTGMLYRHEDKLVTTWDEVWYGPDGQAILCVPEIDAAIEHYFNAPSQASFRTLAYAGVYPWVSVPTDAEAAAAQVAAVPKSGYVSLYDTPVESVANTLKAPSIAALPVVPGRVRSERVFETKAPVEVPADAANHWSKEQIADLLGKGIIAGYEDGTIRPDRTLTRAEFITLLMKGLQLPTDEPEASAYPDASGSWAAAAIAAAERAGIIPAGDGKQPFRPDAPITRLEMTGWVSGALNTLDRRDAGPEVAFNDIAALDPAARQDIRKAANNNIMAGYPDGGFRPDHPLTRAEAFVVISKLIRL